MAGWSSRNVGTESIWPAWPTGPPAPLVRAAGRPGAAADRGVRARDPVHPDGRDPGRTGRGGGGPHGAAADTYPRAPAGAVGDPGRGRAAPAGRRTRRDAGTAHLPDRGGTAAGHRAPGDTVRRGGARGAAG